MSAESAPRGRGRPARATPIDDEPLVRKAPKQLLPERDEGEPQEFQSGSRAHGRAAARTGIRGEHIGRDGEVLTRKKSAHTDIFESIQAPKGWKYQWCAVSVHGNSSVVTGQNLSFHSNGWRPVKHDRHPGVFAEKGAKGAIIWDSQMLMERPASMDIEARNEEIKAAHQQMSDRNDAFKLGQVKGAMPSGFEMGGKYRGTGGSININIDQALDAPRASYKIDE